MIVLHIFQILLMEEVTGRNGVGELLLGGVDAGIGGEQVMAGLGPVKSALGFDLGGAMRVAHLVDDGGPAGSKQQGKQQGKQQWLHAWALMHLACVSSRSVQSPPQILLDLLQSVPLNIFHCRICSQAPG